MSLQSIAEFSSDYGRESSLENDLISRPVFIANTEEEIGTIEDILVDDSGHFRYLVISTGEWFGEQQFLLPVGLCRAYNENNSVALIGIDDRQVLQQTPPYHSDSSIDYDYEEGIRNIYRQFMTTDENSEIANYDRDSYSYDREPELYQISSEESQIIKLYEERLIADKQRRQAGEVTIGKRVETETAEVEIPVKKEKVVVRRNEVGEKNIEVDPNEVNFEEGAVAKVKVYEETANIEKKVFVREEVEVKKEVETEIINNSETLRKERLEMMSGEENIEVEK